MCMRIFSELGEDFKLRIKLGGLVMVASVRNCGHSSVQVCSFRCGGALRLKIN